MVQWPSNKKGNSHWDFYINFTRVKLISIFCQILLSKLCAPCYSLEWNNFCQCNKGDKGNCSYQSDSALWISVFNGIGQAGN